MRPGIEPRSLAYEANALPIRDDLNNNSIELMWCEIRMQENKEILLSLIQRPQNSNMSYLEHLSDSLENALNEYMPVFLIGELSNRHVNYGK